ncbi:methylglyoxal synthase [Microaceticoccus formicicus]|uniref:methylglyoxal synthase n=1 Tax=Microaceticoccus formicicus TaxID=3118105 RepID=UPI003CCFFF09|nr:methylglyoxal synthase [Peptoniphilaceae bacterium AMB_02]
MPIKKRIAIVAHDNRKDELVEFLVEYKDILKNHTLCGTGTTSKIISEKVGLDVFGYLSGPLGGDLQIGSKIATNEIDLLIFFWDPLEAQPHDPDVKALLRISVLYDIPIITNEMTGKYLFSSELLSQSYEKKINIR